MQPLEKVVSEKKPERFTGTVIDVEILPLFSTPDGKHGGDLSSSLDYNRLRNYDGIGIGKLPIGTCIQYIYLVTLQGPNGVTETFEFFDNPPIEGSEFTIKYH